MSQQPPLPPSQELPPGEPGPRSSSSGGPSGPHAIDPRGEQGSPGQSGVADQQPTAQQPHDQQVPPLAGYPPAGPSQPPYGDPAYRQQPYEQPGYGQQPYAQPGYGPAHYAPAQGFPPAGRPLSQSEENLWALLAHASIPFLGFVGPLVVYLVFKDRSRWLGENAVEALNFSILYTVVVTACSLLSVVIIGALLLPVVFTGALVFAILAAVAANRHEVYRYPLSWRLVR